MAEAEISRLKALDQERTKAAKKKLKGDYIYQSDISHLTAVSRILE